MFLQDNKKLKGTLSEGTLFKRKGLEQARKNDYKNVYFPYSRMSMYT